LASESTIFCLDSSKLAIPQYIEHKKQEIEELNEGIERNGRQKEDFEAVVEEGRDNALENEG
jgi:hypothetical protein